ncbi:MAG: hypothetical protein MZV65_17585 [Chromatiales bacterium]|nr:hypothetical protein [Chromatiales bacterium]
MRRWSARSSYSDYPAAARSLPRVGDGWRVDLERVLALRPDVVLAWSSGTPQRDDRAPARRCGLRRGRGADLSASPTCPPRCASSADLAGTPCGRREPSAQALRG